MLIMDLNKTFTKKTIFTVSITIFNFLTAIGKIMNL